MSSKTTSLQQTGDWPWQEGVRQHSTQTLISVHVWISMTKCSQAQRLANSTLNHCKWRFYNFTSCCHDLHSMMMMMVMSNTVCMPCQHTRVVSTADLDSCSKADTCHNIVSQATKYLFATRTPCSSVRDSTLWAPSLPLGQSTMSPAWISTWAHTNEFSQLAVSHLYLLDCMWPLLPILIVLQACMLCWKVAWKVLWDRSMRPMGLKAYRLTGSCLGKK